MKLWLRRIFRVLSTLFALLVLVVVLEIAVGWRCKLQGEVGAPVPQSWQRRAVTDLLRDYPRPEDDTFLSYPEWYIVWSYQEKADYQQTHLPSGFPYWGAVQQYWGSYCCISRLLQQNYPFNVGEQVMLVVIGTSFSTEYTLKGAYEKTIGRLSEWTSGGQRVEEDEYAYKVAREYADFVRVRPFYEFRFAHHVGGLWAETHFWGAHWIRKCERKAFLTIDYTAEAFYCWLIEKATHASYGYEPTETYAWISNTKPNIFQQIPRMKQVKEAGRDAFIVEIPRYQEFTTVALELAGRGVQFVNIAGNSKILVSVLAPKSWRYSGTKGKQLFWMPILSRPETQRVVIVCDSEALNDLLRGLKGERVEVEHIYDY